MALPFLLPLPACGERVGVQGTLDRLSGWKRDDHDAGGGWEYPLFWLFAQASLVLAGSGAFALQSGAGMKPKH